MRKRNNKYKGIKVLLPEGSSRQVLPMAQAFSNLGCSVITVQENKLDLGNVTKYASKKIRHSGVDTNIKIANKFYMNVIKNEDVDIVVPLSDFSAEVFARNKIEIEKNYTTKVAVNDWNIFSNAYDKMNTMLICMENGIPCPKTYDENCTVKEQYINAQFPLILKPCSSCGSIGLSKIDSIEEIETKIKEIKEKGFDKFLIQEYISPGGKQYNAHFFVDLNGEIKTALVVEKCRWFPIDGGASTFCRTIHNDNIINVCTKLLQKMNLCNVILLSKNKK